MGLRPSRFNVAFREGDCDFVFGCLQGGLLQVPVGAEDTVQELLLHGLNASEVPKGTRPLVHELVRGGLLVDDECDELDVVQKRTAEGSACRMLGVTIVPTLACNLRCTYCFQDHPDGVMSSEVCDAVITEVGRRLDDGMHEGLDVDWFGGEPLLARRVVLSLSHRLRAAAVARGLPFEATMATNGVLIDDVTARGLLEAGFVEVQVTLDGPGHVHNARRRGRNNGETFDRVLDGIAHAAQYIHVRVRVNVDRDTVESVSELLDVLDRRGLLRSGGRVLPYIANTIPVDARCAAIAPRMLSQRVFFEHALRLQEDLMALCPDVQISKIVDVPRPLDHPCGATSESSFCVDPSGRVFKCGLDIHHPEAACGSILDDYRRDKAYRRWTQIDPLRRSECRECVYLPLCLGGCPRLEGAMPELARESCIWFREFFVRSLRLIVRRQKIKNGRSTTRPNIG